MELPQGLPYLLVGYSFEFGVMLAHRHAVGRLVETDQGVDFATQGTGGVAAADGHGKDEARRSLTAQVAQSGAGGDPDGASVVHEHDGAPGDMGSGAPRPVEAFVPVQRGPFPGDLRAELVLVQMHGRQSDRVEQRGIVVGDRPDTDFRCAGHADGAHDQYVQGNPQGPGHLHRDRDAATWEGEHDGLGEVVCAHLFKKPFGQLPAGLSAVVETHDAAPFLGARCGPEDRGARRKERVIASR